MASSHGTEPREVAFAIQPQQQYAFHLRLTPQLLESLIRSQEHAEPISIQFGDAPSENAIMVGNTRFRFRAISDSQACDLLRIENRGDTASVVAHVKQKIQVQRDLEIEKDRVRARAEEAERERRERKVVSLVKQPPSQGKGTTKTHVRSITPPPRGPTPPPRQVPKTQLTQSMLAPPPQQQLQPRPPLPPVSVAAAAAAAAGRLTPPPEAAAGAATASGKPGAGQMKKSASSGKLGLGMKHGSSSSLAAANGGAAAKASAAVVAVASRGDLRQTLLAMLAERPLTMQGVRGVLADVASRIKDFKVISDKAALERALKRVGEFRAPGKYFLHDACAEEARALMADGSSAGGAAGTAGGGKRSRESTPEHAVPPRGKAQKAGQPQSAKAGPQVSPGAAPGQPLSKQKRSASQPVLGAAAAAVPAVAAAATPPVTSPASQAASPPSQQTTGNTPAGTASGDAAAGPGAMPAAKRQRQGGAGSTHGGRSSSSRGSQDYDDTWVEEHATRQPEPAEPISSKEGYREREAAFTKKYELYFRLHQLIEANKRDFQALRDALQAAASPEERQRHQAEIDKLLQRRGDRAKRWEAAFGVLHAELAATKQRMGEFVAAFQQQQQQVQQAKQQVPAEVSVVQ